MMHPKVESVTILIKYEDGTEHLIETGGFDKVTIEPTYEDPFQLPTNGLLTAYAPRILSIDLKLTNPHSPWHEPVYSIKAIKEKSE